MHLSLDVPGPAASSELSDFAHVQIAFATWWAHEPCHRARVTLTHRGPGSFACGIQAWFRALRPVEAGATGGSPWEAIREAANLLEVACFERVEQRGAAARPSDAACPGDAVRPGDAACPGDAVRPGDAACPGDAVRPGDAACPGGASTRRPAPPRAAAA